MKILIVSATYPPAASATAGILANIVRCFQEDGHTVDALTVKSHMAQAFADKQKDSTVYYADYAMYDKKMPLSFRDVIFKVKKRIRVKLKKWRKVPLVDLYDKVMAKSFFQAMKKMDMQSYDAIISVCAYYGAAEAVVRYKEKYGLKGMTALYQVDPLADNLSYKHIPEQERLHFEERIFSSSDVIFTTPIIYDGYQGKKHHEKMISVEFPYITGERKSFGVSSCKDDDKSEIKFVFAGYLYPTIRNPKFLLDLFSAFQDPRFKLYIIGSGMEEMLKEYKNGSLKDKLVCLGRQPSEICDKWFEKADVLVNISNLSPNQVPSKLFQYISSGKPILNVYKLEKSPCLAYLGDYSLAVNVFEGNGLSEDTAKQTEDNLLGVIGKRLSSEDVLSQYEHCTPKFVVNKMLSAIRVIAERKTEI